MSRKPTTSVINNVGQIVQKQVRAAEEHAIKLRQMAEVGPLEKLNPQVLMKKLDIKTLRLDEVDQLTPEDYELLSTVDAKQWSGSAIKLPGNKFVVLLNPTQTPERARATLMEEIAHAYFKHKPSQILDLGDGRVRRIYDEHIEQEAYWTGAATLLPSKAVAQAIWRNQPAEALAEVYEVSLELVKFRIKILRLWEQFSSRTQSQGEHVSD
jgi:Zn-dependent peptidase ImmA (M78 family)